MSKLYDTDFSSWEDETAKLLVKRRFKEIDLEALIEEVQDLAGHTEMRISPIYASLWNTF